MVIYYIGVDVGTASARAALVTAEGKIISSSNRPIRIWEPERGYFEQSSDDIWRACVQVIIDVTDNIEDKESIHGIGFDATCSLVVLDKYFRPLTASPTGSSEQNIIMWMDHRAESQAKRINATNHDVLKYVGGLVSVEMQIPKLLWLKENLTEQCWNKAGHFMDLGDFLTWKATQTLYRSMCSLVCKCTYVSSPEKVQGSWDDTFFNQIGMSDLVMDHYTKIGNKTNQPGDPCGQGLSLAASEQFNLKAGMPVGAAMIDAHAGGIGSLGCNAVDATLSEKLVLILGTSSCFMAVHEDPLFVRGVWGPYYSAMVPGMWLNEGGQSASGKLIDHVLTNHPAYDKIVADAKQCNISTYTYLDQLLGSLALKKQCDMAELTRDLHVWPDFHGNRSPLADPTLKGMITGLSLSSSKEDLALLYLATIQALAYGTKLTIDAMVEAGHNFKVMIACGGISKNVLFIQTLSNVIGLSVVVPDVADCVLRGAAILGACASRDFSSIQTAMQHMGGDGTVYQPDVNIKIYHKQKYQVFQLMLNHQRDYKRCMENV